MSSSTPSPPVARAHVDYSPWFYVCMSVAAAIGLHLVIQGFRCGPVAERRP